MSCLRLQPPPHGTPWPVPRPFLRVHPPCAGTGTAAIADGRDGPCPQGATRASPAGQTNEARKRDTSGLALGLRWAKYNRAGRPPHPGALNSHRDLRLSANDDSPLTDSPGFDEPVRHVRVISREIFDRGGAVRAKHQEGGIRRLQGARQYEVAVLVGTAGMGEA